MEDLVKCSGIDFLDRGRITSPRVVDEAVDAAVMPEYRAYGFLHAIKLRHINRDRQAAWKLPRQFLQRIGAASKQGDFRAPLRQSNRRRKTDPGRSARDNEYAILDLHP